jgi:hypothetical protein
LVAKGSTRAAAEPRPRVIEPEDGPEDPAESAPLEITTGSRKAGRRVVIFYIDGTPHSVPEDPPAIIMINYLDQVRRHGAVPASTYLLEAMLGTESYTALCASEDITQEQLGQVIEKVDAILMASQKGPKGGS